MRAKCDKGVLGVKFSKALLDTEVSPPPLFVYICIYPKVSYNRYLWAEEGNLVKPFNC